VLLEADVRSANVDGGKAIVDIVARIDPKALQEYVEQSFGLTPQQETQGKFRMYVLSYTVEGMDPNRVTPQVTREEVTEDNKNVHASSGASTATFAEASSRAASLQAAAASSNRGSAQRSDSASLQAAAMQRQSGALNGYDGTDGSSLSGSYRSSAAGAIDARAASSQSAQWDKQKTSAVNAHARESSATYAHAADAHSEFSDTSTYYHKLVIYSDPNKRGAGSTNEVRAKLGEALKTSGFRTAFYDLNLMGQSFNNEDELYHTILLELKKNAEVQADDYVAVALNRFTPLNTEGHRYSSQVTYRVLRIRDGDILLPDKNIVAESGEQPSDDMARSISTELALKKADDILPGEIRKALNATQRMMQQDAQAAATSYTIRVDNIVSPAATVAIKQALRSAGLGVTPQFRGGSKSENIAVALNGKSGNDVMAILEPFLAAFDVVTMDERSTVLKAR
jgi:hypothetical protein